MSRGTVHSGTGAAARAVLSIGSQAFPADRSPTMRLALPLLFAAALATPALARAQSAAPAQPVNFNVPEAAAADVASVDAIVAALYDVISGPVGQARDWNRLRSLFVPGGRMMPVGRRADGGSGMRMLQVNDYVAMSGQLLVEKGFHERELARRSERFGDIAHVFSTYEGRIEGEAGAMRGINSIQLMHDGRRWWIVSLMWQAEGHGVQLPAEYLPRG